MNKQNVLNIVKEEELETLHPLMQADAANPNPTYGSAGWMDIKTKNQQFDLFLIEPEAASLL